MILLDPAISQPSLAKRFEKRKFTRRNDLTSTIRLEVANTALYAQMTGAWGTITDLANKYDISRTFVYSLGSTLIEAGQFLFGEAEGSVPKPSDKSVAPVQKYDIYQRASVELAVKEIFPKRKSRNSRKLRDFLSFRL